MCSIMCYRFSSSFEPCVRFASINNRYRSPYTKVRFYTDKRMYIYTLYTCAFLNRIFVKSMTRDRGYKVVYDVCVIGASRYISSNRDKKKLNFRRNSQTTVISTIKPKIRVAKLDTRTLCQGTRCFRPPPPSQSIHTHIIPVRPRLVHPVDVPADRKSAGAANNGFVGWLRRGGGSTTGWFGRVFGGAGGGGGGGAWSRCRRHLRSPLRRLATLGLLSSEKRRPQSATDHHLPLSGRAFTCPRAASFIVVAPTDGSRSVTA